MSGMYDDEILALAKRRRDDSLPEGAPQARIDNPLCGDTIILAVRCGPDGGVELFQRTRGCLLCEAAAQRLADIARDADGKALADLCAAAEHMFETGAPVDELRVFSPVIAHPARHECVLLPFRALQRILQDREN